MKKIDISNALIFYLTVSSKGNSCLETGTNLTANQGWIPSSITMETGCGSRDLPWMITVDPGQRINVTLLDFSVERTYHVKRLNDIDGFDIEATVCNEYAVIHEVESERKTMVCGGNTRWKEVYLSKTNTLRIEITNTGNKYFIIKYEGEAVPLCLVTNVQSDLIHIAFSSLSGQSFANFGYAIQIGKNDKN